MSRCNFFISFSISERSEVNALTLSSSPDFLARDSYNSVQVLYNKYKWGRKGESGG